MPRTTKDSEKEELNKKKTSTKKSTTATKKATGIKSTTVAKKKKVDEVKPAAKVAKSKAKKEAEEKTTKTTSKKSTTSSTTKKKSTTKASSEDKKITKKAASTKTTTKKKTSTVATKKKSTTTTKKKATSSTTRKKSSVKKLEENIVAEYYDLPYRYNETVVKILYQTPTILFVYWDISDFDRENYIKQYGENFFNNTKPVLKVYNLTKDYCFEVEINDFANSWYINVNDANCIYKVELSRKKIDFVENLHSDYVYITTSNDIEFPNDHILLDELPSKLKFRNIKTNQVSLKDVSTLHLIGINKIYNVYDFYKSFYKDEIAEINANAIINPSSSSWN